MDQFVGKPHKKLFDYTEFSINPVHEETTDASMPAMKWPPPYPEAWNRKPQRPQHRIAAPSLPNIHIVLPSIPTIVGYLVIAGCCVYTTYEVICLLVKAFPQAIR